MEPFDVAKPLIGMVHLLPTPLSPEFRSVVAGADETISCSDWDLNIFVEKAVEDARILTENGADGIMVENYHDTPFYPEEVPTHTITAMSIVVREIVRELSVPVGVNILRNACMQALGVASISGASFIRCNVLTGSMLTTEGMINGRAHEILRYRESLPSHTKIYADIFVKHAFSLVPLDQFEDIAIDTFGRGGADALIISGKRTGTPPSESLVAHTMALRDRLPEVKLIAGSGIRPNNIIYLRKAFDAFIVGTYFQKYDEDRKQTVIVPERVREMKDAISKRR
jgi:uncharacterized protein